VPLVVSCGDSAPERGAGIEPTSNPRDIGPGFVRKAVQKYARGLHDFDARDRPWNTLTRRSDPSLNKIPTRPRSISFRAQDSQSAGRGLRCSAPCRRWVCLFFFEGDRFVRVVEGLWTCRDLTGRFDLTQGDSTEFTGTPIGGCRVPRPENTRSRRFAGDALRSARTARSAPSRPQLMGGAANGSDRKRPRK